MGLVESTLRVLEEDDDEMVFMVPATMTLSMNQMNVMLTAGQQPGVPFRLAASGAERPQGIRKKVKYAENLVSLQKQTMKLTKIEVPSSSSRRGDYSLEFVYDAYVPSVVKIYVGTRELPCYKAQGGINLRDTVTTFGPFFLSEGRNRTWSSMKNESCTISWKQLLRHRAVQYKRQTQSGAPPGLNLPRHHDVDGHQYAAVTQSDDVFDVVVCLAPVSAIAHCALIAQQPNNNNNNSSNHSHNHSNMPTKGPSEKKTTSSFLPSSFSQLPAVFQAAINLTGGGLTSATGGGAVSGASHATNNNGIPIDPSTMSSQHSNNLNNLRKVSPSGPRPRDPYPSLLSQKTTTNGSHHYHNHAMAGEEKENINNNNGGGGLSNFFNGLGLVDRSQPVPPQSSILCEVSCCQVGPAAALAVDVATLLAVASDDHHPNPYDVNPFDAAIVVRCVSQRVQVSSGCVYLMQDIYGMDRNQDDTNNNQESAEEDAMPSSSLPPSTTTMTGEGSRPEQASSSSSPSSDDSNPFNGGGGGGIPLDADAVECVICLTDPRVLAVYPCRHMCLCASCAEVLPSQGNKCPICRRAAAMLICIDRDNESSNCPTHKHGGAESAIVGTGSRAGVDNDNHSHTTATLHPNINMTTSSRMTSREPVRQEDCVLESYHQYEGHDKGDHVDEDDDILVGRNEKEEGEGDSVVSSSVNLGSTVGLISQPYREQPSSHVL